MSAINSQRTVRDLILWNDTRLRALSKGTPVRDLDELLVANSTFLASTPLDAQPDGPAEADAVKLLREINECRDARLPQDIWNRLSELLSAPARASSSATDSGSV